jgi:5-methylcytosine-specific restriction endonuclease McrA
MPKIIYKLAGSSNTNKVKSWSATSFDYSSQAWRKTREYWLQSHPLCAHCEEKGKIIAAKIVDHKIPIRFGGDAWDESNFQSLCENCHNKKTASEKNYKPKKIEIY